MPPLFYVPHENPNFDNAVSYLPADMIPKPPKRAGVAFQVCAYRNCPTFGGRDEYPKSDPFSIHSPFTIWNESGFGV